MWSVEFVEVPEEKPVKSKESREEPDKPAVAPTPPQSIPIVTSKQPSLDLPVGNMADTHRLDEYKDTEYLTANKEVELGSSAESDSNPFETYRNPMMEPDLISFDDEPLERPVDTGVDALVELEQPQEVKVKKTPPPRPPQPERMMSLTSQTSVSSDKSLSSEPRQTAPTSPSADFVFVTETEVKDAMKSANDQIQKFSPRKRRGLRDGQYQCFNGMLN